MLVREEVTPRLTTHARERCAEMGITTKVAKAIYQARDLDRPSTKPGSDCRMATCSRLPEYAVVYFISEEDGVPVIASVVFKTYEVYERDGETFRPV